MRSRTIFLNPTLNGISIVSWMGVVMGPFGCKTTETIYRGMSVRHGVNCLNGFDRAIKNRRAKI